MVLNDQEFAMFHTLIEKVTERKATENDAHEVIAYAQKILRVRYERAKYTEEGAEI